MSTERSKGIEIELLGDIRFRIDGRVSEAFPYDKVRALFAVLAVERGQSPRREWLANLLWPQLPATDGRRNLRIALTHLNKLLVGAAGPGLLADRLSIRFAPGAIAHVDVDYVEQAPTVCGNPVDASMMIEALRRYRGPFLGGLALPGNAEFEEWAGTRREACLRRAIAVAEGLAAYFHAQGAIDRALEYTERAFDLDRHRETGHRRLIEMLAASGRHVAARAQYQAYERLLVEQVGGALHGEARTLRARLDAQASAAAASAPAARVSALERRHVTVLQIDLWGAPDDDSEEAALRLESALRSACTAVARQGGHALPQSTGVLAYFGYPAAREHGARDALRAARAVVDGAAAAGAMVRCALHSGTMLSGNDAARPDALGLCTRLAVELCRHAEAGGIVASTATRRLLGHDLACVPLSIDLGLPFAHTVQAFRLSWDGAGALDGRAAAPASAFVGRAEELAALAAQWRAAQCEGPRLVLVRGEAGVGKSRLLGAFGAGLREQGAIVHEAGCDPRHGATPYFPVLGLLAQVLGLGEGDSAEVRRDKVGNYLRRGGPWGEDAEVLLAYLLGIGDTDRAVAGRPAQQLRDALENLLLALFAHGAAGAPLVLVIEDVHWADPSTLALLGRLLGASARPSAMLLLTARPNFAVPWPAVAVLELGPLPATDTAALVSACLGGEAPAAGIVGRIVEVSDGVPLYAEEMARMVAAGHPWGTIPPTLQDVLAARLEVVVGARRVVAMAATIGREFSLPLLAAALTSAARELRPALARLCAAGVIELAGDERYRFRHALVQEAAYGMQGERARCAAHAAVAGALRGAFAARAVHAPEILAHHLAGAGRAQEAIDCWLRAARSALARAANLEAVAHAEAGLGLVEALPAAQRAAAALTLRIEQGIALLATAGYGSHAAAEAFAQAHALLATHTDAVERFRVLWGVWMGSSSQHGYREALKLAQTLHGLAVALDRPAFVAASHYALGNNLFWLARFEEAQGHFEAAVELVEQFPHREAVLLLGEDPGVTSLAFLGWVHWFRGRPQAAVAASEEALALGRRSGHPHSLSFALTLAAVLHRFRDDPARVAELAQELLALAEARGLALWAATGALVEGWALARRGDAQGLALVQQAFEGMQHTMVAVRVPFLSMLAESCMALGLHVQALGALALAEAAVNTLADFHYCAELARLRARCLAASAAPSAEVRAQLLHAVDTARSQGAPLLELRALDDLLAAEPGHRTPPQAAWHARRSALRAGVEALQG